jgi:hypothetical protein
MGMLVGAAKQVLINQNYQLKRVPGRGGANMFEASKKGKLAQRVSIRTTRDRWFAFPPLKGGSKWKTLDEADVVVVAALDDPAAPKNIQVYSFPGDEVRARFDDAYKTRVKAGRKLEDNFGMWVALDPQPDRTPHDAAGSGLAVKYPPLAVIPLEDVATSASEAEDVDDEPPSAREAAAPTTIRDVVAWARDQIAQIAGVRPEAVKLDVKVEY